MSKYQKAIERGIENGLNRHFKAHKKLDETCERIAKTEPKVWLSVDDAKFISKLLPLATIWAGKEAGKAIKKVVDLLDNQIEQAEKCNDR